MTLQHAQLKANALITLDNFVAAFIKNKKNKILNNQRIDMAAILKLDEYVELNKAVAELNKFNAVNSTPEKEEKIHKALLSQIID